MKAPGPNQNIVHRIATSCKTVYSTYVFRIPLDLGDAVVAVPVSVHIRGAEDTSVGATLVVALPVYHQY